MRKFGFDKMDISVDFENGYVSSLVIGGIERIADKAPLFTFQVRDTKGNASSVSAFDAKKCTITENSAVYSCFDKADCTVTVTLESCGGEAAWGISIAPANDETVVEWVDFPSAVLPKLKDDNIAGNGGEILFPYNEGAIISSNENRENSYFPHADASYPSRGSYTVFPNMLCSQMIAYIWSDCGLYFGAHDEKRGVKEIDFYEMGNGIALKMRLYCGTEFGQTFKTDYPLIWSVTDGNWQSAAQRYRAWFDARIGCKLTKTAKDKKLPEWYADSPLIVSYPVRGIHDMDEMKPNKLFPYVNALPLIDEVKKATDSRVLVALMHWEGTAPWAPPFVWPPYGGVDGFNAFRDALHENGDMLGVYCSGFGYTIQSNLIDSYNCQKDYDERGLDKAMCTSPYGKVEISNICTAQRSGYDICPASEKGRELLKEAYKPLFESGIDYAQILDQNHGGGQYFCYGKDHGHPPVPGAWMTENMQSVLLEWNDLAPNMLFGCESAAAEPFIHNLRFSDNRFELNYSLGKPVPLYAYIYHEYLRNFMGNQVSCPLESSAATLCYRLGYSFTIGDSMTLVFTPDGDIMSNWGTRDFDHAPDKNVVYPFIKNLNRLYKEKAKDYLLGGKMIKGKDVKCGNIVFKSTYPDRDLPLPEIISYAWEYEGKQIQILTNPTEKDAICTLDGKKYTVPALDAIAVEI